MVCGIYKITNMLNNECYIGKSIDIDRRWKQHKYRYDKAELKCYNYHLYRAFRKYGIDNFNFEIIEICDKDKLIGLETKYFNIYKPSYCMQTPKSDVKCYDERWREKCREGWKGKSDESKKAALINLSKGKGARLDKKPIMAIKLSTNEEIKFESLTDAQNALGIPKSSISQILNQNHNRKSSKGYTFKNI